MPRPPITKARPYTRRRGAFAGRRFTTEREYRDALAQQKGFRSWADEQRAPRPIRTTAEFERLSEAEQYALERAYEAKAIMLRTGASLEDASAQADTTPNNVLGRAGTALRRDARGRYYPTPADHLFRRMRLLTARGHIAVDVTDSRTASSIAQYENAVREFYRGRPGALRPFRGRTIRVGKIAYPLITDHATLRRIGYVDPPFNDLYAHVG